MHLRFVVFLVVYVSLFCVRCFAQAEDSYVSQNGGGGGCIGTEATVIAIVNASNNYMFDTIIVNCLAFSDNASSISLGVVSHSGVTSRSTVKCVNDVLVVGTSTQPFSENVTSCHECEDSMEISVCPNDADCSDDCRFCYGPSQGECLVCDIGRYDGVCVDSCPTGTTPNPENGNECECPSNHGGTDCAECLLTKYDCPSMYYFDEEQCLCTTCPDDFVFELKVENATVPSGVIGVPLGDECYKEHDERRRKRVEKKASETHESEGSFLEDEELFCEETCSNNWEPDDDDVCYACGIQYCLECELPERECIKCRDGTLLSEMDHRCHSFYEEICELAIELEEEVEHEEESLEEYQLHLKIALPIVCTFVLLVFVAFAVFAHFRYPHVGHEKRHRRPNKATTKHKTDFEKALRPKSTVIFR